MLLGAIAIFYVAYALYDDPAVRQLRRRPRNLSQFPALPAVPRVSFLLAVKDEAECIEPCVRSMLDSYYPDLQVIVVDDGSTDGTREILDVPRRQRASHVLPLEQQRGQEARSRDGPPSSPTARCSSSPTPTACWPPTRSRAASPPFCATRTSVRSAGTPRALNADESILARIQDVWYDGQFGVAKAAESAFGSVTCVSGPLAAFRRDAVYNYFPAWAGDRFLGGEFRFATDRQLTGYVLGQQWIGRRLKRRHADDRRSSPTSRLPDPAWRVGYVGRPRCHQRADRLRGPSCASRCGGRRASSATSSSPDASSGGGAWSRRCCTTAHAVWVLLAPGDGGAPPGLVPLQGTYFLTLLYLAGVLVKGTFWGLAFRLDNPGSTGWRYRPLMSLLSSVLLSWLLFYSAATIRRGVWSRSAT